MSTVNRSGPTEDKPSFEKQGDAVAKKSTAEKSNWERDTIEKVLMASITEQRRQRRWGIFFKSLFFAYLVFTLWLFIPTGPSTVPHVAKPHVALIDIKGLIMEEQPSGADNVAASLREAFKNENAQAILLRINSPGGSPVQSTYIYNEIQRLKEKHPQKNVYAVCTDSCTSAAYYIASAADFIYASPVSIVGSIGVLFNGFGFVNTIEKIGVERRLMTSGKYKGMLDPFSPLPENTAAMTQQMLDQVHEDFINKVILGRGDRLVKHKNDELFSGRFWTGSQAKPLGLIDGFGSTGQVAREIIENENLVDYTLKPNYLELFAKRFGASVTQQMAQFMGLTGHRLQ